MTETEINDEEETLNSFFAKKDKSNKPKKKKKTKSDEASKGGSSENGVDGQVDDWKDFEEEKEKDYSGLKIQNLQVVDGAKEEGAEEGSDYCGDDEDGGKGADSTKWNIPTAPAAAPAVESTGTEIAGTQNVVGGKYVPPSVKRSNMLSQGVKPASRRPLQAPDIQSQAAFPTLGAAHQDLNTKTGDFEAVKGGTRTTDARVDDIKPSLSLGNRYDSLGT